MLKHEVGMTELVVENEGNLLSLYLGSQLLEFNQNVQCLFTE